MSTLHVGHGELMADLPPQEQGKEMAASWAVIYCRGIDALVWQARMAITML